MATRAQMLGMRVLAKKVHFRQVLAFSKMTFWAICGDVTTLKQSQSSDVILAKLAYTKINLTPFCEFGEYMVSLQIKQKSGLLSQDGEHRRLKL
jgi:hypothetical protein